MVYMYTHKIKVVLLGEEHLQGNVQHFELALQEKIL